MGTDNRQGTSAMPEPKVFNYNLFYKITPMFLNDLKIVMKSAPYCDADKIISYIESQNNIWPASAINELINKIAEFPYRLVYPIMKAIENKEIFTKYFEEIKPEEIRPETH